MKFRRGTMRLKFFAVLLLALLLGSAVAETNLKGAGATFPYPIYSKWFNEYHNQHPDVAINYQPIGSGGGITQLQNKTVDFGASDGPMNDDQLAKTPFQVFHIPTLLGAAAAAHNLPGPTTDPTFTPHLPTP